MVLISFGTIRHHMVVDVHQGQCYYTVVDVQSGQCYY